MPVDRPFCHLDGYPPTAERRSLLRYVRYEVRQRGQELTEWADDMRHEMT